MPGVDLRGVAGVFRDRLSMRQLVGMAVAFAGVALIAGEPRFSDPVPILLILGASLAWAVANIQIKWLGALDNFTLSGWMASSRRSAVFTCPVAVNMSPDSVTGAQTIAPTQRI